MIFTYQAVTDSSEILVTPYDPAGDASIERKF